MTGFSHHGDRLVHQGHIWRVVVADFTAPDGEAFQRDIVRSPGAVAVVALTGPVDDRRVWLVRQYRPALDAEMLEIPAGMRDVPGEAPETTAARELAEECGLAAGHLELLTVVHPTAGMTDATTHIYLALDPTPTSSETHGPEERAMTVLQVPLADAVAMVIDGTITDAKTVIGLLLTEQSHRRGQLDQAAGGRIDGSERR
jgi:8-oxo-dGTP pyrophosphatase MutT (NUDIX family)